MDLSFSCTPWSRLSDNPRDFKHPLAKLVVQGVALLAALRKETLILTVLNEPLVPHEDLVDDLFILEQIMGP